MLVTNALHRHLVSCVREGSDVHRGPDNEVCQASVFHPLIPSPRRTAADGVIALSRLHREIIGPQ